MYRKERNSFILLLALRSNLSFVVVEDCSSNKGIPGKSHQHGCRILCRPLCILCVCWDVTTNKYNAKVLSTLPFSPHSVGLITTSYSVLRPLRKHRTLLKQNALAKNMAFLNCNSVTDSCLTLCMGSAPLTVGATSTAAFTELFKAELPSAHLSSKGPFLDLVFVGGTVLRSASSWGIAEESLPRRKDS